MMKGDSKMSSKNKAPSTPEARAEKLANKQMLRKVFTGTFLKAFAVCLAILLVCSIVYIAFINPNQIEFQAADTTNAASGAVVPNNGGTSTDTGAGDGAAEALPTVTELTASSSQAEILSYFNDAINKVKTGNCTVTLTKEINSQAGNMSGNLPSSLTGLADSLIKANMGEKDVSATAPASTEADKNAIFPVENESWSSKLTASDISNAAVTVNGDTYTITIEVLEDAPSADTAHNVGHMGKAFSVVTPDTINANAGGAAGVISNVQTGHSSGRITVTVDKATGNVLSANYYFVWTLSLTALSLVDVSIPFGLEKEFSIAWN